MASNPMRSDRVGVFPSDIEELARCIVNGPLLFGKERASVVAGQLMFRVTPTASKKSRLFRLIAGALANGMHRHRIARPQRENRCDTRRLTIRAFSGADGPCASLLHTRGLLTSPEKPSNLRLAPQMTKIPCIFRAGHRHEGMLSAVNRNHPSISPD